jgi:DNA-binding CsgD family transcriptional regulator
LERSTALTPDAERRAQRAVAAANAYIEAGAAEAGARLLAAAEAGPLDTLSRAQVEVIRGRAATAWGHNDAAARLFLSAAKRFYNLDVGLARDLHVRAMGAAVMASDLTRGVSIDEAAKAARAAPPISGLERPQDLLLDGLAAFTCEGLSAAAPILREALSAFRRARLEPRDTLQWSGFQCAAANMLWDLEGFQALAEAQVQAARDIGALASLPQAISTLATAKTFAGDFSTATVLVGEGALLIEATASNFTLYAAAQLAGVRGRETEAANAIATAVEHAHAQGQGMSAKIAQSARAVLLNGLARHGEALAAAKEADRPPSHWSSHLQLHELVEAAARSGQHAIAADALARISVSARASGSDWALGVEARSRALFSQGDDADPLYLEAIERLDRSPARPEAARAHLLYGEWLRQQDRRADARRELRAAHEQLSAIGMEAFAERAARELAATGETVRARTVVTVTDLTAQETQIARLVADGRTNQEIGAQLFISARTVEWHLRKVFTKLDVRSRRGVRERMTQSGALIG